MIKTDKRDNYRKGLIDLMIDNPNSGTSKGIYFISGKSSTPTMRPMYIGIAINKSIREVAGHIDTFKDNYLEVNPLKPGKLWQFDVKFKVQYIPYDTHDDQVIMRDFHEALKLFRPKYISNKKAPTIR